MPGATLFPEMGATGGGTLFDQAPEPTRVPAGARPAVVEKAFTTPEGKEPLRFDNQTGRYNGEKLERGDILTDKDGNRYQLDRQLGYILQVDQINEKGQPRGSKSFSVEPTDKSRYRDLYRSARTPILKKHGIRRNILPRRQQMPKKQEEAGPPTLRVVNPKTGLVIYPKMHKDQNGNWQISNPDAIRMLLGTQKKPSGGT
jgi:hypothetical protein